MSSNTRLAKVDFTAKQISETRNEIIKIIHEEAQACYSEQKSADDVAKVIQNRVSLYVCENI